MAQLAISAAGAVVGFYLGGPVGAQVGWAAGSMIGAQFGPKQKSAGPRLDDLRVTGAEYGQTIPWIAGHPRLAGQVWWASDRREISTTTSQGKGGGGAESTAYTYEVDILYGLTDTIIAGVSRVWLNGKLVYVTLEDATDESVDNSVNSPHWDRLTVYTGAADQLPDPAYEAVVTNAPAYRGRGSVFIEGLQLGSSGVIPNLTFEIATSSVAVDSPILLYVDYRTESPDDASCYLLGAPVQDIELPTFSTIDGLSINQTRNPSLGSINAYTYQFNPTLDYGVPPWTIELIVKEGGDPYGANVFSLARAESIANYAFSIALKSSSEVMYINQAFVGLTTHPYYGGNIHVAIVYTGTQTRYYVDGYLLRTESGALSNILFDDLGLHVGGFAGNTLVSEGTTVTYKQVMMTSGEKFTSSFAPPAELDAPVCTPRTALSNATLQETVEALCERSMPAGTYDATDLASITKPVRAFALAQISPTRSAIEQLMAGYFFEAYLSDKLYFVPRAGSVADTIDADDMGAGLDGPEDETLPTQIGSDLEIPAQVSVSYSNVDSDYTVATEHSDRLLSGQINTSIVQLPLGFTSAEGKGIADAIVLDGYSSRVSGTFSVPLAYSELTPTDVVTVPDADGNVYRVRIVRRTDEGPLLKFEWVLDDPTAIESAGITSDDYTPTIDVVVPGPSIMELLDIPLLRDADNTLGHYVAITSSSASWPGASIQRSISGVEYTEAASINERAVLGTATSVLADFTSGHVFDELNSVTVNVGSGALSSRTRAAMLADASLNVLMVGDELIRFCTATMGAPGVYTLTRLLRGQYGTEWAMTTHVVDEPVVLLQTSGIRYVHIDLPSVGTVRYYKGVTHGRALSSADAETFTCAGVSLKPWAPTNIRQSIDTGYVLTWDRRTRVACGFTGSAGIVVPLGEFSESYRVTVMDGPTVVEEQTVSTNTATVGVDGLPDYTGFTVQISQLSETVGAGTAATHTIY